MVRWHPVRRARFIRRCVAILAVSSCATLVGFQMKLTTSGGRRLPPWRQQLPGATEATGNRQDRGGGNRDGRENRTERARRIMERQIYRDSEEADHRHDDTRSSQSSHKLPWFFTNGTEWPRPTSKLSRFGNVWPDPKFPQDDRIVAQLMYLPPGYKGQLKSTNTTTLKNIILHGSWHDFLSGRELFLRDRCPVDTCAVYWSYGEHFGGRTSEGGGVVDAVIYQDWYVSKDSGSSDGHQVKILYLLENPMNTYVSPADTGINWTATYRRDSDIVTPYEKFVLFNPLVKRIKRDHDYAQNKTKMVAWFVSNCGAANRRLEYAHELQKHIQVDIYGACGTLKCPRSESERCYEMLDSDYYFYLSFENANCKDYITEKFYNALRHNVVPVVMGASREEYRAAAPYHSYIHVDDFASPKELAEYLRLLSSNHSLYNQYFEWKGTGEFVNTYFWCRLCALLHAPPRPADKQRRTSVHDWWHGGTCKSIDDVTTQRHVQKRY